jgi:hypothetical protein
LNAVQRAGIAAALVYRNAENWWLPHRARVTVRDIGFTSTY